MLNLIKADLFRSKKARGSYYFILVIIMFVAATMIFVLPDAAKAKGMNEAVILIKNAQRTNAVMFSEGNKIVVEALKSGDVIILLFLPIIMSVFINDFSFATIRNSVISGYSKVQIYFSKVISCIIASIPVVLAFSLVVYIMALIKGGYDLSFESVIDVFRVILLQAPLYIAFISIACLIGVIFKSKTVVCAVSLLYQILCCQILNLLGDVGQDIAKFEPISVLDKAADIGNNTIYDNFTFVMMGIVLAAVTMAVGILYVKRMDIK